VWFVHMGMWIDTSFVANSLGRFTKYLWPFYKADKDAGRITDEEVVELIEFFMIKTAEVNAMLADVSAIPLQNHTGQTVTLGGFDEHGRFYRESQELDFLYLEAEKQVRLQQPSTVVVWTRDIPDEYMARVLETVKIGLGKPAFINGHVVLERHLRRWGPYGLTTPEAYDIAAAGCVQTQPHSSADGRWGNSLNGGKILWMALNNGVGPTTGKQFGPQTGPGEDMTCFEQVWETFWKQLEAMAPIARKISHLAENFNHRYLPTPFVSAMTRGCLERGKDVNGGGARYENDSDILVGGIDLANSFAALKKVVFEEKKCTMRELMTALRADFAGERNEEIRQMLRAAPKFGNNDPYVDDLAFEIYDRYADLHADMKTALGNLHGPSMPSAVTVSSTSYYGIHTEATPDGRKARTPFCDGSTSPAPGTDINGPTTTIISMAKAMPMAKYSTNIGNMKFHPTSLSTRESRRKLADLIRTYMDLGGNHIQFQVVDTRTLREAQACPNEFRDLVVRVAGYSAFFVTLHKQTQEEIIGRNENHWEARG
jgi:pyruvate-formate lyase